MLKSPLIHQLLLLEMLIRLKCPELCISLLEWKDDVNFLTCILADLFCLSRLTTYIDAHTVYYDFQFLDSAYWVDLLSRPQLHKLSLTFDLEVR